MDNNYFDRNESKDYKKLVTSNFNDGLGHFNRLDAAPKYYWCDAFGNNDDNRTFNIELKNRDGYYYDDERKVIVSKKTGKTFDSAMIEAHKVADLMLGYFYEGGLPLYYNFFSDKDDNGRDVRHLICYNLLKLSQHPKKYRYDNIESKGYQEKETDYRFLLPLKDAFIYRYNDTLNKFVKCC